MGENSLRRGLRAMASFWNFVWSNMARTQVTEGSGRSCSHRGQVLKGHGCPANKHGFHLEVNRELIPAF